MRPHLCHAPPSSFMDRKSRMRRAGMAARGRPAKAGIQEGRSRGIKGAPVITRLQKGHSRFAGMGLCDWIPAFVPDLPACLLRQAAGRHRSATCIPAGAHPCRRACAGMTGVEVRGSGLSLCVHCGLTVKICCCRFIGGDAGVLVPLALLSPRALRRGRNRRRTTGLQAEK